MVPRCGELRPENLSHGGPTSFDVITHKYSLDDKQGNPVGYETKTDVLGYYSFDMQELDLQKLGGEEQVYIRVISLSGEETYGADKPLKLEANQRITK